MILLSDHELETLLAEDIPYGDLTTASLRITDQHARITFATRAYPLIISCTEEAARLCTLNDLTIQQCAPSGTAIAPNTVFLEAHGQAWRVHRIWKSVQNLLDYACGITTYTDELVRLAHSENANVAVGSTRKTAPFTKKIAIKAVESGGGIAHRLGLSESILIFEYHRIFFPNDEVFATALQKAKIGNPEKKIVIEAENLEDALKFARMGADVLQLEKFPLFQLTKAVDILRTQYPHISLIATGGINLKNIAEYAATGVDMIVTTSPYNAQPADIKVRIEEIKLHREGTKA